MQFFTPENLPVTLITMLSGILALVVTYYGIGAIKMLKVSEQFKYLGNVAEKKVLELRQVAKMAGYRKKELAMIALRAASKKVGANLPDDDLSMLIEAAVKATKHLAELTETTEDDELIADLTSGMEG